MENENTDPAPGDVRVWYIPQVPMEPFTFRVRDTATAAIVLDAITEFSSFEYDNNIKPDYSDVGGISVWEEDGEGGFDWSDLDPDEMELG